MNDKLKKHLVDQGWAAADATEDALQAVVMEKLRSGELTGAQYAELLVEEKAAKPTDKLKDQLAAMVKDAMSGLATTVDALSKKLNADPAAPSAAAVFEKAAKPTAGNAEDVHIRVKAAVERYDDTRSGAVYKSGPMKQSPIAYNGRPLNHPTERKNKMVATWVKFLAHNAGYIDTPLTEHEQDIIRHILNTETFYQDKSVAGVRLTKSFADEIFTKGMNGSRYKADLINDSGSGGQQAVPEFFDEEVIILPVLEGELAPFVTMKDMPRGSEVQGFTMGNITFAAANTEGSAVSLFDATSFIADYSPSVYRAAGFIQVGRNFLQDAVPGLADEIRSSYTRQHNSWLDRVVAAGNGTTEPQGIMTASGTTDVPSQGNTDGPVSILDAINLIFGVTAPYRRAYNRVNLRFGMTETSYKRFRSIQVGSADARLVFGNNLGADAPELLSYPVGYEVNGLTNKDAFFSQLGGYWLYRRQGLRLIFEDRGSTLVRANTVLIGADMRYAGQLTRGGYAAIINDLYA